MTGRPLSKTKGPECGGLCTTCRHAHDCTFPRDPDRPVFHCLEFDANENVDIPASAGRNTAVAEFEMERTKNPQVPDSVLGLCRNCANYGDCKYSNCPGGVWHCEEYR